MRYKIIFYRGLIGLNTEFTPTRTVAVKRLKSLVNILPISRGKIIGSIDIPRGLAQCKMQTASFRILT